MLLAICSAGIPEAIEPTPSFYYTPGMHNPRAGSGPRACFILPSEQVKNTRNFFCMTEII